MNGTKRCAQLPLKIIEASKNKLKIELVGEDHTVSNLLTKTLLEDPAVTFSSYSIEHPLVSNPVLVVLTDGSKTAKQALMDALLRIKDKIRELRQELDKALGETVA